jgi:hypothetical protein
MADDAFAVQQAPWRHTALPTMVWGVESYAVWPLVLWWVHLRWSTFGLALGAIIFLTVIRYFGLDARSTYRLAGTFLVRALANGHLRALAPYWERRW